MTGTLAVQVHTIRAGSNRQLLLVVAGSREPGAGPRAGLRAADPGATAASYRSGEPVARPIPLREGIVGEWTEGGFVEVDPLRMPGVYQYGVPDDVLSPGAERVVIMLRFPNASIDPIDIDLVGFDPQDGERLGLAALSTEGRLRDLRLAFPHVFAVGRSDPSGPDAQSELGTVPEPMRRGLIGLPIQRSIFDGLWTIGELVGVQDVLPEGRFGAWFEDNGDLHVREEDVRRLRQAFGERVDLEMIRRLEAGRSSACGELLAAVDRAGSVTTDGSAGERWEALLHLIHALRALGPYPIMTKFVPSMLQGALRALGDEGPPPFPDPSPGLELSRALLDLAVACDAMGFGPADLDAAWPDVPQDVASQVRAFCVARTGFGPVAWEWPGYETAEDVIAAMITAFGTEDVGRLRERASSRRSTEPEAASTAPSSDAGEVRSILGSWLEFMDLEIWYFRRAFYLGLVPLLRSLRSEILGSDAVEPSDLLFAEVEELEASVVDLNALRDRRERYAVNQEYLERAGIDIGRLAQIMEA